MADSNNSPILSKEQIDYVVDLYSHSKYEEAVVQIKILNEKMSYFAYLQDCR